MRAPLHYAAGAAIWRKKLRNVQLWKLIFLPIIHFVHEFFGGGSLTSPKIGKRKNEVKHHLVGKNASKVWKNIFQISHLIFWLLQAAKYLIYDFTFTFSFFSICSKLNWPLFHLYGIFACKKKGWTRLIFPSEIFGCGENERQSSEILNDIAPIALAA